MEVVVAVMMITELLAQRGRKVNVLEMCLHIPAQSQILYICVLYSDVCGSSVQNGIASRVLAHAEV